MPKIVSNFELELIEKIVSRYPAGVQVDELLKAGEIALPRRTLQRRLNLLIKKGRLIISGKGAGSRYQISQPTASPYGEFQIPLSPESQSIRHDVNQPLENRISVSYNREFLDAYHPNETYYLSSPIREHLKKIGSHPTFVQIAGTYAKEIYYHLLIDLSWNSSRLEGNTYSLLETERLLDHGEKSEKKSTTDTQMILNHKDAIGFLVNSAENITFNEATILNLHALLSNNLLGNPAACGRLRTRPVGVTKSAYSPSEIPQLINECFDQILKITCKIQDPFEQAFFIMVHLPYLQPFDDVNKRVSRLAANIPLIKNNFSPLSFIDVPEKAYIDGFLGIYELNRFELLRDVFVWAYERSSAQYTTARQVLGEPDPFRLKYRQQIIELIKQVIQRSLNAVESIDYVQIWTEEHIQSVDQARFREVIETELLNLHPGNIARFRIGISEFDKWNQKFKSTTNIEWKIEWEKENGEVLYCWNPVADLNEASFESVLITMNETLDRNGLFVTHGKTPQKLIVSTSDEWIARKLCETSEYKRSLPKNYQIDQSLQSGQWFIKFVNIV